MKFHETARKEFLRRLATQLDYEKEHSIGLAESDVEIGRSFRALARTLVHPSMPSLVARIDDVIGNAYGRMSSPSCTASFYWRKLYTDACITKALVLLMTNPELDEVCARASIASLDHAIIMAGAPGSESLGLILDLIRWIQSNAHWQNSIPPPRGIKPAQHVLQPLSTSIEGVPCIVPPSLSAFQRTWCQTPFVLKSFVAHWPAVRNWPSMDYLFSAAGPGRIVPVEVGNDYRSDDWKQKLLGWEEFLSALNLEDSSNQSHQVLYLAQHDLLKQFPALREDIVVPDYVYALPDPLPLSSAYRPPSNEDQLVINVWFGPRGSISPAHTDPFFNCYAQVVGRKTIWLAPPDVAKSMYPYGSPLAGTSDRTHNPAANVMQPSMSNTSCVDVFPDSVEAVSASKEKYPAFWDAVPHKAHCVVLDPGDLVFFPPGWWHAMRSEDVSFSVSMWF